MKAESYTDTPANDFPGISGVNIRWLVGKKDGAPNFAMRVIEVAPGSNTPFHSHDYEHEVFVLNGQGGLRDASGNELPLETGSVVYISPNEEHGFYNTGAEVLRFICVVPHIDGLEPAAPTATTSGNIC